MYINSISCLCDNNIFSCMSLCLWFLVASELLLLLCFFVFILLLGPTTTLSIKCKSNIHMLFLFSVSFFFFLLTLLRWYTQHQQKAAAAPATVKQATLSQPLVFFCFHYKTDPLLRLLFLFCVSGAMWVQKEEEEKKRIPMQTHGKLNHYNFVYSECQ